MITQLYSEYLDLPLLRRRDVSRRRWIRSTPSAPRCRTKCSTSSIASRSESRPTCARSSHTQRPPSTPIWPALRPHADLTGRVQPAAARRRRSARGHPHDRRAPHAQQPAQPHVADHPRVLHSPAACSAAPYRLRPPAFRRSAKTPAAARRPSARSSKRTAANPTCAACHRSMDPIGLGMEDFDQYRSPPDDVRDRASGRRRRRPRRRNVQRRPGSSAICCPKTRA